MPAQSLPKFAGISRDHVLWAVLSVLVVAQIVAFWMLCSHQVRKAEARDATLHTQQVALADCLRYVPRSTLESCTGAVPAPAPAGIVNVAFR